MSFGVIVTTRTAPPAKGAPIETGTLHVAAAAGAGPTDSATLVRSLDEFEAAYTDRAGSTALYDYLDAFFSEGGARAYVARYTTDYGSGLALLDDARLGPGQLAVVGENPVATLYTDMQSVATAANRVVLRDVVDNDTIAAMETTGDAAPADDTYGATFAPWATIPPPRGVVGAASRVVPASAIIAALCNRADLTGNPNRAAAGRDFPLQYATGFVRDITDVDRAGLFTHGINAFKDVGGVLENYGFQTNVPQDPANPYWQFNVSRLRMYLVAQANAIGENYMFKPIDGKGHLAGALAGDLNAMLKDVYDADGLYSPDGTAAGAYGVSVQETITDVAQGTLHAVAEVQPSMHAKAVQIDLVTVPIGNPV